MSSPKSEDERESRRPSSRGHPVQTILWIEDLVRPTTIWPWGMFDLAREPILQGCRVDMVAPLGSGKCPIAPEFDPVGFRALIPRPPDDAPWRWLFRRIPDEAFARVDRAVPDGAVVISFEMPPWLSELCDRRGIPYLDFRVSPIRFCRDLYLAVRTNAPALHARLIGEAVTEDEIRLEAGMLAASIRMHQGCLDEQDRYPVDLDGVTVFVGQAPYDTSIIDDFDRPLRTDDYADRIRTLVEGRTLLHKPHPMAPWFADEERRSLAAIVGVDVRNCPQNAYQILGTRDDVHLIGISSGMLQEARYFGKTAHTLFRPFVPVAPPRDPHGEGTYLQVRFDKFLAPGFWHRLLTPALAAPRVEAISPFQANHLRETSTFWWDYSKVMTWQRPQWIEAFERSGGGLLRARIERLEAELAVDFAPPTRHGPENVPHHEFRLDSGERQGAADFSSIRADYRFRYEWAHDRIPAGGFGLDAFCGSGFGTWMLSTSRSVWGIDDSSQAIRCAERRYAGARTRFSVGCFPFELPPGRFDFVVSLGSIERVADGEAFFAMLARSLAPGGWLAYSVPCEDVFPHSIMRNPFHHRHYTFEDARGLATLRGLEIVDWAGQDVHGVHPDGRLQPLGDESAMRLKPGIVGQFVVFLTRRSPECH